MSKKFQLKPHSGVPFYYRRNWPLHLLALVIAGAVFALLFGVVDFREARKRPQRNQPRGIVLMAGQNWNAAELQNFRHWMHINDPRALTSLDAPEGFLSKLPLPERFPRLALRPVKIQPEPVPEPTYRAQLKLASSAPIPAEISWPQLSAHKAQWSRTPLIVDDQQGVIKPFGIFQKNHQAQQETVLKFFHYGAIPASRVVRTCGNRLLDFAALRELSPRYYRQDAQVTVFWPSSGGEK